MFQKQARQIPDNEPSQYQETKEGLITDSSEKSHTNRDLTWLWSGIVGATVVVVALILVAIINPRFRVSGYYVNEDPSLLIEMLSSQISSKDSLFVSKAIMEEAARRKDVVEDLLDQRVIVSSEDFASNLTGYYNTLITALAAILVILNIFGYFSLRSNANAALEKKLRELDDVLKHIDTRLEQNLEEIFRKNLVVREKLEGLVRDIIEQGDQLNEEELVKLHLLLKQYEREEVLKAIESDEIDNNGTIEEE